MMNIVVFSVGPIFPQHVHGGSQKILREIALYWGKMGHQVNILCTFRRDNAEPFQLGQNVFVSPILHLKETYPEPYYTAPYNLANLIVDIRRAVEVADVLYVHDGELLYHFLYKDVPTVVSFRDFVYPDTLAGAFSFRRDLLILNSQYVAKCVVDAFSTFCPSVVERLRVIPNGINLLHFRPSSTNQIRKLISLPEAAIPILYPHRPDPRKGIYETIEVIAKLRQRLGKIGDHLRLLVPLWVDGQVANNSKHIYQTIYSQVQTYANELDVCDLIVYHPWISYELMPEYYSLGRATLCIGNFVEAFGNSCIESVACGTPCIVSRVATYRDLLPDRLITKVDYGDLEATVDAVQEAIKSRYNIDEAREFIDSTYGYERMLVEYERAITEVQLSSPLQENYSKPLSASDFLKIPAWCYYGNQGYYNDYSYGYDSNLIVQRLLKQVNFPTTVAEVLKAGFATSEIEKLLRAGLLVKSCSSYL
jgi:glycosyltransferase involved in cell wall biosynthesis